MRKCAEDKNHNPILHVIFNSFHKRWFSLSCFGVHVLITTSAFYWQRAFREHSLLPANFLFSTFSSFFPSWGSFKTIVLATLDNVNGKVFIRAVRLIMETFSSMLFMENFHVNCSWKIFVYTLFMETFYIHNVHGKLLYSSFMENFFIHSSWKTSLFIVHGKLLYS